MLRRWAAFVATRPRSVLAGASGVLLVAGLFGFGVMDSLSHGGYADPQSESVQELVIEREVFGNRSADVIAIYSSDELLVADPAFESAVAKVVRQLPADLVSSVVSYQDAPDPAGMVSRDGRAAQVVISLSGADQDEFIEHYKELAPLLEADGLRTDLAGTYAVYTDVDEITAEDLTRAELLSLPLVVLLALVIFGTAVSALLPAVVGGAATVGALAMVRLVAGFTEVSVFAVNVISLLGIGLAVDYALFVVSRFREELATAAAGCASGAVEVAVRRTVVTAGRTVLVSGLTIAAAMSSLLIFPQAYLRSLGYGGIAAVLVAMAATLTILPAILRLLGARVDRGRIWTRRTPNAEGRWWAALARGVMGRPVTILLVVAAGLLVIAAPFAGARFGSVDHRVLPADAPAHRAATMLDRFGDEISTANIVLRDATAGQADRYLVALTAVPRVDTAEIVAHAADVHLLRVTWSGGSQSEQSQEVVRGLRTVAPEQGQALVGGMTADTVDLIDSIGDTLPWMGLMVAAAMLVLLFLAFGSLVLPLKAIAMNLLSVTASFGVVAWIFSDGHLSGLLDFTPQGFIDATNPVLMLAVLFGLSMDYEVFLLSRIREEWDRTGDNETAVAVGIQRTGRIITSAALLLAVVIGAFATSGLVFMKELGIGMLVAILVDATIVRALLVPAAMKLLGRWNWWAPHPLSAWWRNHAFHEAPLLRREPSAVEQTRTPTLHGPST